MRLCPLCQSVYPDNAYYCSVHGVRLADVRPHIHQPSSEAREPASIMAQPTEPGMREPNPQGMTSHPNTPAVIIPDPPEEAGALAEAPQEPTEVELAEQTQEEPLPAEATEQTEAHVEVELAEQTQEESLEAEPPVETSEESVQAEAQPQRIASSDEDDLTGTTLRSYKLIKHLGTGATGPVYLAKHIHDHNRVAIKILHSKLTQEHKAVAKAYSTLEHLEDLAHRNLVETTERVQELDAPSFYVMEALAGANLATTMASSTKLNTELILEIALQMARTLAVTHSAKIYHGHLTPRNVFLLNRGTAESMLKVLDFDAAPLLEPRPVDEATAFSRSYRAPDLAEVAKPSAGGDIFGLGAIIQEMLSSLDDEVVIPGSLVELVHTCTADALEDRIATMDKVVEALEDITREERSKPRTPGPRRDSTIVWAPEAMIDPDVEEAKEEIEVYEWQIRSRAARKRKLGFMAVLGLVVLMGYQGRGMIPGAVDALQPPALAQVSPSVEDVKATVTAVAAGVEALDKPSPQPQPSKATSKPAVKTKAKAPTATPKPATPAPPKAVIPVAPKTAPKRVLTPAPAPKPTTAPLKRRRPVEEPKKPEFKMVRVEFTSSPEGAKVMRTSDDAVIGTTPVVLELPQGVKADSYRFSLAGYETTTQKVTPTASMRVIATMDLLKKPSPKPAQATKAKESVEQETEPSPTDRHALIDPFADEQG
ncbi:MAG: protein kinase [Myxococcota bacterium]|nr:protein kinase [Myxococcota bacterium]